MYNKKYGAGLKVSGHLREALGSHDLAEELLRPNYQGVRRVNLREKKRRKNENEGVEYGGYLLYQLYEDCQKLGGTVIRPFPKKVVGRWLCKVDTEVN